MGRLITLASGQFGDMPLEDLCKAAQKMGYDGLELATHAHFDVQKLCTIKPIFPAYAHCYKDTVCNVLQFPHILPVNVSAMYGMKDWICLHLRHLPDSPKR